MSTTTEIERGTEKVREMAHKGKERFDEVTHKAAEGVDSATTKMGRGVERAGAAIEKAGTSAGQSTRHAGRYMQESDPAKMKEDIVGVMGRHPGMTLAIGVGAGLLLAQLFKTR